MARLEEYKGKTNDDGNIHETRTLYACGRSKGEQDGGSVKRVIAASYDDEIWQLRIRLIMNRNGQSECCRSSTTARVAAQIEKGIRGSYEAKGKERQAETSK